MVALFDTVDTKTSSSWPRGFATEWREEARVGWAQAGTLLSLEGPASSVTEGTDVMQEHRQFGERIAQARGAKGLAQREIAAQLGVSERTVQNYESGASPPHRHLHEIEAITEASHAWVLYGDETGTRSPSEPGRAGSRIPLTETLETAVDLAKRRRREESSVHRVFTARVASWIITAR